MGNKLYLAALFVKVYEIAQYQNIIVANKELASLCQAISACLALQQEQKTEDTALQINSSISHTGFCLMSFVTDNLINLTLNSPLEIQE